MIHNPMMGFAMGDADDLETQADLLRKIENKIVSFYAERTGQTKSAINEWMKGEKFMTAEEALELGFITEIAEEMKIAAIYIVPKDKLTKNPIEMSTETKNLLTRVNDTLAKVQELFGKKPLEIEANLSLNTKDGGKIEIVTSNQIPNPKDKVLIDSKPAADGEYLLMDGTKIVVAEGMISTVTDPEGNSDNKEEIVALKAENAELKATLKIVQDTQEAMNATMELIAEDIKSTYDPKARKNSFATVKAEIPKNETPAQAALRMKAEKKTEEVK